MSTIPNKPSKGTKRKGRAEAVLVKPFTSCFMSLDDRISAFTLKREAKVNPLSIKSQTLLITTFGVPIVELDRGEKNKIWCSFDSPAHESPQQVPIEFTVPSRFNTADERMIKGVMTGYKNGPKVTVSVRPLGRDEARDVARRYKPDWTPSEKLRDLDLVHDIDIVKAEQKFVRLISVMFDVSPKMVYKAPAQLISSSVAPGGPQLVNYDEGKKEEIVKKKNKPKEEKKDTSLPRVFTDSLYHRLGVNEDEDEVYFQGRPDDEEEDKVSADEPAKKKARKTEPAKEGVSSSSSSS